MARLSASALRLSRGRAGRLRDLLARASRQDGGGGLRRFCGFVWGTFGCRLRPSEQSLFGCRASGSLLRRCSRSGGRVGLGFLRGYFLLGGFGSLRGGLLLFLFDLL